MASHLRDSFHIRLQSSRVFGDKITAGWIARTWISEKLEYTPRVEHGKQGAPFLAPAIALKIVNLLMKYCFWHEEEYADGSDPGKARLKPEYYTP
ncbi:hypothetical protein RRF57_004361 [Xylaria bambusicola]|uniref:Uncharacterized protein n=1 Tax=Xylaria bambusicola TaxID=326684 RepID=A0AAN7UHP6_9PEZI